MHLTTGETYMPHTGAAPPARILLAAHRPLTTRAEPGLMA